MVSFRFEFDKPDKKYKAGETVQVRVIINVFSKFKARSLSIRFKGFAHTEWTKSRTVTSNGKTRTVHDRYTGDEEYFRSYQYMHGNQNSGEQSVDEGTHTYRASFTLPNNLPSNIEHSNGHIRYTVKANYDVPWGFDKEETAPFYVTAMTDLNDFTYLKDPVRQAEEKVFGCCCCESDPMQLTNVLPKGAFVPGETIPVTIEIDNNSDVRIDFVRVKLKECITFYTRSPRTDTRDETTTLNEHFFQTAVAPFQKKQFQTTFYLDPSHDYKLYNGCGIITCKYYIKAEAEASGCHSNPYNSTDITIGTIPFANVVTNGDYNSISPAILAPSAPPVGFDPKLPTNGVIMEQPLPSYNDIAAAGPSSSGFGWNVGLKSPSGAPLASTEKMHLMDDLAPPSFEDIQKDPRAYPGNAKAVEAGEATPSAPSEPTASATAPPE